MVGSGEPRVGGKGARLASLPPVAVVTASAARDGVYKRGGKGLNKGLNTHE